MRQAKLLFYPIAAIIAIPPVLAQERWLNNSNVRQMSGNLFDFP